MKLNLPEMKKISLLIFAIAQVSMALGQCKGFVKNNCGEAMGEYVPGESFNAAKLFPGDVAEVEMTFYSGIDYRLLICSHEMLGDVRFQLSDEEDEILYDNAEFQFKENFDFRMEGTRTLTLKLMVPENEDASINPQGCVAILLGRKLDE